MIVDANWVKLLTQKNICQNLTDKTCCKTTQQNKHIKKNNNIYVWNIAITKLTLSQACKTLEHKFHTHAPNRPIRMTHLLDMMF